MSGERETILDNQMPGAESLNTVCMYRFPDIPVIFGTDIEGGQRIDAACHADEDASKHRDQAAG